MQTLASRGVGDAAAGLGLHFLHMSEGPFPHAAGHILNVKKVLNDTFKGKISVYVNLT